MQSFVQTFVKKALARREELIDITGTHLAGHNFEEVFEAAVGVIDEPSEEKRKELSDLLFPGYSEWKWNRPVLYENLMSFLISWIPISDAQFHRITRDVIERYDEWAWPRRLGMVLRRRQIAKGMRVAEIGGTVAGRLMEALGAESVIRDAGRDDDGQIVIPQNLVTLENYQDKVPGEYDFTISSNVFDSGSGVEATSGERVSGYGAEELLAVFANITKQGGYSFHGRVYGKMIDKIIHENILEFLGFSFILREKDEDDFPKKEFLILRKETPRPDLLPAITIRIGMKIIGFDKNSQKFKVL